MTNKDYSVHRRMADHAIPLTPKGKEQAKATGEFLSYWFREHRRNAVRLWVSPCLRARQTADEIQAKIGINLDRKEHILLSGIQFGLFDGLTSKERTQKYPEEHALFQKMRSNGGKLWAPVPLGESPFDVAIRVNQMFGRLHRDKDRLGIEDIIIVAHGTVTRTFVLMWLNMPYQWFNDEPSPGNGSVRLLEDDEDKGYIYGGHKNR